MKVLGISAFYHDSAAAITVDGKILAAAQEERFTRVKHDPGFPFESIKYCLKESGLTIDDLDAVCFYDKPFLKFERLLETYYGFAPKGLSSFIKSVPIWVKEKLFLKKNIRNYLYDIEPYDKSNLTLLFTEHHLSHAASAFYPSPFEEAAILTIDGVGEWATASICVGNGREIKVLKELQFPHSLGLLYSSFTYFLGFKVNSGEYKMMGLAPYGNAGSSDYNRFKQLILDHLVHLKRDGSIWLNQSYFSYATGLRMVNDKKWEKLFGLGRRSEGDPIRQKHMDLALAIQHITEDAVMNLAQEARRVSGSNNLCLAGGVALNCVANGKLHDAGLFNNIWIQPAAGDAGGALGAALATHYIYYNQKRNVTTGTDGMQGAYLGPAFSDAEVETQLNPFKAKYDKASSPEELFDQVARLLNEGQVVGWFQGRMEFGPRALGHRSILGDPRSPAMQKRLNLKIKYRESFRPFAPAVLASECKNYFQLDGTSPYMLLVKDIQESRKKALPEGFSNMNLRDKLETIRADIPAVTHVDYSARIQTVDGSFNPEFFGLINAFKAISGYGLLINTSLNVRGEPIVCSPEDAYRCFMRTEMDYLVINNYIFDKRNQDKWQHQNVDEASFELD